jgi:methionine-rich copper-binding protein CopC
MLRAKQQECRAMNNGIKGRAGRALVALALVAGFGWGLMSAAGGVEARAAQPVLHLSLVKSEPAKDAEIGSPKEIRLFFSEAPKLQGSTIRLTRGEDALVPTTRTEADAEDSKQLVIRPEAPLAPGNYTVYWRVIASDDHAMQGNYAFRVVTE